MRRHLSTGKYIHGFNLTVLPYYFQLSLIKCNTTQLACFFPLIFIQKYHFCHHLMVNITSNPTINLFYFHAPPMGHSFKPFLTPPLDQQMSCHFADFHPSLINRFHLAGKLYILIWVYLIKKLITVA